LPDNNGTPVVITIDNNGRKIKSHVLYETAKTGIRRHTSNTATVLSNRHILFTDSTVIKNIIHKVPDQIFIADSISVTHKSYVITENGTIKTLN